ncbi:GlcG/HbpS family heme-binding protein [Sphingomonas immobilis]|uniref:Heme-binding protein n=1 Tax=Sphingomonas immobilis TaxID=3063997 RepID=A0ABT8ZTB5_9SPHN|nr:heme-binding protein [Sphingomonas sp. CA1-15]MDO7840794.1 heme-binding protein [Sphingomonas sp. CA1-15]
MTLTLNDADRIADGCIAKARELGLQPLTVVILDAGAHYLVLKREDGAGFLRHQMAHAKAFGALGFGKGTRFFAEQSARNPQVVANMIAAIDGELFPSPGGVLVLDAEGRVAGAIGVSGDLGDRDEAAALGGIEAAGFAAATGGSA